MRYTYRALVPLFVMAISMPLAAHHSFVAFDAEQEALVRGTVAGFEFRNPHTYVYVDIPLENGQVASYRVESETRNDLYRNGWRDDSNRTCHADDWQHGGTIGEPGFGHAEPGLPDN